MARTSGPQRDSRFPTRFSELLWMWTLEGMQVSRSEGTQPNSVLRLSGKRLPRFGGRGRGSLFVGVEVAVPQQPSAEERKLYERLRAVARK
jgi:DnaJ-class molecular chaperone